MKNLCIALGVFFCLLLCDGLTAAALTPQQVTGIKAARNASQLIVVLAREGTEARLAFYEKQGQAWREVFQADAYVGRNGLGKEKDGDGKTPVGVFPITLAFGLAPDPGCALGYTKIDESHYWVGDSRSPLYNRLVSTRKTGGFSREDSEHLAEYVRAYQYVLNIGYNAAGKPGLGSAIFLHCAAGYPSTGGGVAIAEEYMLRLMRAIRPGCKIVIASQENLGKY
ncbi:MAG: L,D-transpeptidase family protein [Desulfovibrio sp.]|nr:L,D-transpeptidase family protein [Desulfovibrio sp.]